MATEIQGADIELLVREKNVGEFKAMTCEDTVFLDVTNDVSTQKTKCGVFKGIQVADFKLNGSCVHNAEPTSSELSYNEALGFQLDITKCEFILRNKAFSTFAAGELIRMSGDAYFTQTQYDGSNGVAAKFTYTLEGSGSLNDVES